MPDLDRVISAAMRAFTFLSSCFLLLIIEPTFAASEMPKSFLWGVANSAFQVEGAPADSDIYRWSHESGKIKDGSNADIATDFRRISAAWTACPS